MQDVCGELQVPNERSSRFEKSLPILGAARANISAQGSAPRRAGPWRHGSQKASPTAPALENRQYLRLGTRPPEVGLGCSRKLSLSSSRTFAYHSSHGSFSKSSFSLTSIHSRKSHRQVRLALSVRGVANTQREIVMVQAIANLLIKECPAMNLPCIASNNTYLSATRTHTSATTALTPLTCTAFWIRTHKQQFTCVGACQTLGCPGAASACAAADSGCSVGARHERTRHHPRGPSGAT